MLVQVSTVTGYVAAPLAARAPARSAAAIMGPAKDGPFTPAVKLARIALGDQRLLKLRGKVHMHAGSNQRLCRWSLTRLQAACC